MPELNNVKVVKENEWLFGDSDALISHRRADAFFGDVIARAYEWDLSVGKVISIYGAGGEGKSYFINKLKKQCVDQLPYDLWSTVYLDFYKEESSTLEALRDIFEAFASSGIFCSRFDIAYQSYQHPGSMAASAEGYLLDCEKFIADEGMISEISGPANTLLGVASIACDLAGSVLPIPSLRDAIDLFRENREKIEQARAKREASQLWYDFADHDRMSLLERMPELLQQDIEEYANKRFRDSAPCRLVVIVDSFEHLFEGDAIGALSSVGELVQRISHVPGTLWVVAGRYGLTGEGWDNVVHYPIHLIDLDEEGTTEILASKGITDPDLVKEIHRFSGGIPVFISLCTDALEDIPTEELRLSFEQLVSTQNTRENLLRHYVSDLDDDMEIAVYAMSYLHEWDVDLLAELLCMDGLMDEDMADLVAEDAATISFVTRRGEEYQIHERIAALLRSLNPTTREMKRSFRKLFRNIDHRLTRAKKDKTATVEDARHIRLVLNRALWEMSKHGKDVYGRLDSERLFRIRRDFVEELKWAGLFEEAVTTIRVMMPMYEGQLERELNLLLMLSANLTQLWIRRDVIDYHLESIRTEREVLARIEAAGVEKYAGLYARARNSLGLSIWRIAESLADAEESLSYLQPNYEVAREKPLRDISAADTMYFANYGLICLRAAELCEDPERAAVFLADALQAFSLAVDSRESLKEDYGPSDTRTLRALANKAIALGRLGRFREADECHGIVNTRFLEGEYAKGNPDWLYNRYHQAILHELEAEQAGKSGDSAQKLALLHKAYDTHREVLGDRVRYHAGVQAVKKSKERVLACGQQIEELEHL